MQMSCKEFCVYCVRYIVDCTQCNYIYKDTVETSVQYYLAIFCQVDYREARYIKKGKGTIIRKIYFKNDNNVMIFLKMMTFPQ